MKNEEMITISKWEYENLLFRKKQIEQLNEVADELENGEIDGIDFGEKVLNII